MHKYGEDWRIGLEYSLLGVRGLPTREPRTFYSLGLHLHPVTFLLDADLSLTSFLSPNYQTPPPILFPSVRDVHADLRMDPSNNKPKEVKKAAEMLQNSESPGITAQAMLESSEVKYSVLCCMTPLIAPEALLIKPLEGENFVQNKETEIRSMRKTRSVDVLLQLGTNSEGKAQFCDALKGVLHCCTAAEDVKAAIKKEVGVNMGEVRWEHQLAIVELGECTVIHLVNSGHIRIANVKEHSEIQATGFSRSISKDLCSFLCKENNVKSADLKHVPGTGA
ncbi:hypothetical protein J6590_038650 [Homalodisca vitripennis]|nr:hypothetical protein J6590_038650 [Homalodisca vitripennis]